MCRCWCGRVAAVRRCRRRLRRSAAKQSRRKLSPTNVPAEPLGRPPRRRHLAAVAATALGSPPPPPLLLTLMSLPLLLLLPLLPLLHCLCWAGHHRRRAAAFAGTGGVGGQAGMFRQAGQTVWWAGWCCARHRWLCRRKTAAVTINTPTVNMV